MVRALATCVFSTLLVTLTIAAGAQQQPAQRPGQPARDTPAQPKDVPPVPAGRISGRVLAADNGLVQK